MRTLIVLAGGVGSRLGDLTNGLPKPLADINGRPFLDFLLENWFTSDVKRYLFLLHHKGPLIEKFVTEKFAKSAPSYAKPVFIYEKKLLGTGGAIAAALPQVPGDEFLITNADTWLPSGLSHMTGVSSPCMAVVKVNNASRFGLVDFTDGIATNFQEKVDHKSSGYINAGLYLMNKNIFKNQPKNKFDMEQTILRTLAQNKSLKVKEISGSFMDIGIPEDLKCFRQKMLAERNNVFQ